MVRGCSFRLMLLRKVQPGLGNGLAIRLMAWWLKDGGWVSHEQEVRDAAGPEELRSALASLETAIHEEYLSPLFQRNPLLVKGAWLHTGTRSPW